MTSSSRQLILPILLLSLCSQVCAAESPVRPNVVVILSDDQGWGDLSINGNTNLSTPNIDSLAKDGARFDRFYVCPVCSPTRAEFLTGRYHARGGVYSTSAGGERLDLDETTIADTFKAAGYRTAAFGKWHNGMQYPYHPNGRGFDEYYGFCSGHWGHYFSPVLEHNGRIVRGKGFVIDDFTDHAMSFIEENRNEPFFVYLPYNTPHSPMQVPDRWWDKFKNKELAMRHREPNKENPGHVRAALAMCENIDWNVGRLLKKLDDLKLADNTIVLYFCDNGPNGSRWNGGMKGRKGSTDEGGVRSPLLIRWPAKIKPGRTVKQLGSAIDLLPTLTSMCGVPVIGKKPLDGLDISSAILGGKQVPAEVSNRTVFSSWRGKVSVRTPRFRLDNQGKLFDMHADPGQYKNVADKHGELTARLKKAIAEFRADVLKPEPDNRPFVIGHPDYKYTQVPARDAQTEGGIKRSNRFPNCSYFTNWTSTEDRIFWKASVAASGKYHVDLHYTCPADSVGSTVELSFNGRKLTTKITEAHESPIIGGKEDRVTRQESYVKNFKAVRIGTIDLKKGSGELSLQALEVPGSQVMDFRLLFFTRAE